MAKQQKDISTKPEPTNMPSLFSGDVDRLFDAFAHGMVSSPFYRRAIDWEPLRRLEKSAGVMTPDIDITETDTEMRITAELPGMEEKDIEVEHSDDRLIIRGEKREELEKEEKDYHLSERRYGSFRRTLTVPDTIDGTKVNAEMKNGVLTIVMPKKKSTKSKTRKIAIKKH